MLAAGGESSPQASEALERLCQVYWFPIYAFIRKRGYSPDQAQDLTQEFFAGFLGRNSVAKAARERGRFRSFLMTCVTNFLHNEHERRQAGKRGRGSLPISLDEQEAERRYLGPSDDPSDPARTFERRWAATVLQTVMDRHQHEFQEHGKSALFEALQSHLWGDADSVPYPQLAAQHGISVANVKTTAFRMRRRYREILREEIAQTVAHPGEIDDEIRYLMKVVSP